jgi:hypothetical protein
MQSFRKALLMSCDANQLIEMTDWKLIDSDGWPCENFALFENILTVLHAPYHFLTSVVVLQEWTVIAETLSER